MLCNQCEETIKGGCTKVGVCGKSDKVAGLQDVLIDTLKGISYFSKNKPYNKDAHVFIIESLFSTITNVNFDEQYFLEKIKAAISLRNRIKGNEPITSVPDFAKWNPSTDGDIYARSANVGLLMTANEDVRSLRAITLYGLKGIAAYSYHASLIGKTDSKVYDFILRSLLSISDDSLSAGDLTALALECGEKGLMTMTLLDSAHTEKFGHPQPTVVSLDSGNKPGILVSGHDLADIEELLRQTDGKGIEIYTHGEMLPAHGYPRLKKYSHLKGHYGTAWWQQGEDFESFNGPILMTTNCLITPKISYKDRVYIKHMVGYPGLQKIEGNDYTKIIEHAKRSQPPIQISNKTMMTGFGHNAIESATGTIIEAVKAGAIKQFYVMAGCDGRHPERDYYRKFAEDLPDSTIILTAGCAKFRYNTLDLGKIGGLPRVIDSGQCNDCYSIILTAQKLAKEFGVDINALPVTYNIAWYEQKAVLVLLVLLHLGVTDIVLGPRLPEFISPNVRNVLVEKFSLSAPILSKR